jgi:hypothetical protein
MSVGTISAMRSREDAQPLLDIESAPRDGTVIEIVHGPRRQVARARWRGAAQAFVRDLDPYGEPLGRIAGWRPIPVAKLTWPTSTPALADDVSPRIATVSGGARAVPR